MPVNSAFHYNLVQAKLEATQETRARKILKTNRESSQRQRNITCFHQHDWIFIIQFHSSGCSKLTMYIFDRQLTDLIHVQYQPFQ